MYLSKLRLWNFRKYGVCGENLDSPEPGLCLQLEPGRNVLIGENDSGKTAIIDAIRYTLGTQSGEWIRFAEGWGYEVTGSDVFAAYDYAMKAAESLGVTDQVKADIAKIVSTDRSPGMLVRDVLGHHLDLVKIRAQRARLWVTPEG